jgi:hypothetical protein
LTGVAENITLVPEQIAPAGVAEILTDDATLGIVVTATLAQFELLQVFSHCA